MAGQWRASWRSKQRRALSAVLLPAAIAVGLSACGTLAAANARDASTGPGTASPSTTHPRTTPKTTATTETATTEPATTTTTVPPLTLVGVVPADKAKEVGPSAPIVLTFNRVPGPAVRRPTVSPATAGHWSQAGRRLMFTPSGYWDPATTYRVAVHLRARTRVVKFTTRLPSVLALQQYLAMLGYLPLRFTPTGAIPNRKAVLAKEPTNPNLVPQVPVPGVFTWSYPNIPSFLWQQWHRGLPNVVTTGAVMQFELAQGLAPDGDPGPLVWNALIKAVAKREMDTHPYNYVIVSEAPPETLYVWQDGKFVYDTLTNTGVPGATTPQGTWPVAYKQNPNLMKGCDVNGSCYSVWVNYASYFLPSVGDAIHAYPRPGYGYPQSNGCVEVPESQGEIVYGYDPVGTLVTVTSWVGPAQHG